MRDTPDDEHREKQLRRNAIVLVVIAIVLVLAGLLAHLSTKEGYPIWKSSPYGELHDSTKAKVPSDKWK